MLPIWLTTLNKASQQTIQKNEVGKEPNIKLSFSVKLNLSTFRVLKSYGPSSKWKILFGNAETARINRCAKKAKTKQKNIKNNNKKQTNKQTKNKNKLAIKKNWQRRSIKVLFGLLRENPTCNGLAVRGRGMKG